MVSIKLLSAAGVAGLAVAVPVVEKRDFSVPSANGFPSPSAQQLLDIEKQANGRLSNAGLPPTLSAGSITSFQLIAFNELFETAFFNSLLYNVSHDVAGYEYSNRTELVDVLVTVLAVSLALL